MTPYRVQVRGAVTVMLGRRDHTAGLLPEDVVMTVRVSTDVGADLNVIKEAAGKRFMVLLEAPLGSC